MPFSNAVSSPWARKVSSCAPSGRWRRRSENFGAPERSPPPTSTSLPPPSKCSLATSFGRPIPLHAPCPIVGTPAGQLHELGAVMVGAVAANLGWRAESTSAQPARA